MIVEAKVEMHACRQNQVGNSEKYLKFGSSRGVFRLAGMSFPNSEDLACFWRVT
jgi:hypothetical protein